MADPVCVSATVPDGILLIGCVLHGTAQCMREIRISGWEELNRELYTNTWNPNWVGFDLMSRIAGWEMRRKTSLPA